MRKIKHHLPFLFYWCILNTEKLIIGFVIALIAASLILAFAGCKSVNKSQSTKIESSTVKKSDSSKTTTFLFSDTTKTDSSTTVNTYTVTIDEPEYNHVPGESDFKAIAAPKKAKKVTIQATEKKQAATAQKGISTAAKKVQLDIKNDSTAKGEATTNNTNKKPLPGKTALSFLMMLLFLSIIAFGIYKMKKAAV